MLSAPAVISEELRGYWVQLNGNVVPFFQNEVRLGKQNVPRMDCYVAQGPGCPSANNNNQPGHQPTADDGLPAAGTAAKMWWRTGWGPGEASFQGEHVSKSGTKNI